MHILILGGTGMLGHKLFQHLRTRHPETYCTIRGSIEQPSIRSISLFHDGGVIEHCDAADFRKLENLLLENKPNFVINCIGIVKQRPQANQAVPSIAVNALLPHQLAEVCGRWGGKLIHFSTDCVFSGKRGNYNEADLPDAEDLYGRTKALGELTDSTALTLRTSIIGRELAHSESLLEWFLRQEHRRISGFTRAMYSGVTTNYMARVVANLIATSSNLSGLYQVASAAISKFDLLCLLRKAYGLDVAIHPDSKFFCDRSMKGDKFEEATGQLCPAWPELVSELANDDTPYVRWKQVQVATF
ncbi:MAG: SDR family oxidoreductase [Candidatus Acidiferrales bacterium]|jgi:dTDP-4-dehydrorhamnose reductase